MVRKFYDLSVNTMITCLSLKQNFNTYTMLISPLCVSYSQGTRIARNV